VTNRQTEDQTVFVRPRGHVEERPVVRPIGDQALYLGNRLAADPDSLARADSPPDGETFEFVLTVSQDSQPLTTHHRPLADGPGNSWPRFEAAVDTARRLYRRDGSLLCHCKAGISRSTTVVATTIAAEESRPFRAALDTVQEARPHAIPHPALHEQAVLYLAAQP
jgi:Dual specificity phosphatase, catalytic domain.